MSRASSSVVVSLALSLALFVPVEAAALGIGCNNEDGDKESSGTNVQLGANNSGDSTQFTGDKQVTIESPSSGEEDPSPNSPTVQASDPSMWEEQPHWDCNTKSGKGPDDPLGCVLGRRMPIPQDDTTDASGGSGPRTITTRQAATLIAQGSGITRQPPGPKVIISMAFIVYTNPTPRYLECVVFLGLGEFFFP